MPRRHALAFALLAVLLPLALPAFSVRAQASPVRFEGAPCMFDLPKTAVEGTDVACGYVTVPELHANPTGPTIKLAVAVFKSPAAARTKDANIYLEGGPGATVNDTVRTFYAAFSRDFTRTRDFVLFDQRGVGKSQPSLTCPETVEQGYADNAARASYNERRQNDQQALLRCRDRFVKAGVNLNAYRTSESAADVNDIRAALGYDTLNLVSVSYGTRLALTTMRDFPRIVRSAVIDSALPLEATEYEDTPSDYDLTLKAVFASCARSQRCAERYPDLQADFAALYVQLNASPRTYTRVDRATGREYAAFFNGDSMVSALFNVLYTDSGFTYAVQLIEALKRGTVLPDEGERRYFDVDDAPPSTARVMHWSVQCADELPFNNYDKALANAQGVQFELREWSVQSVKHAYAVCAQWGVTPSPAKETAPVQSNLPALVMTSANDPATPPRYGRAASQSLSQSFLVAFPGIGHSAIFNGESCGVSIAYNFIANPAQRPNTSCTRNL